MNEDKARIMMYLATCMPKFSILDDGASFPQSFDRDKPYIDYSIVNDSGVEGDLVLCQTSHYFHDNRFAIAWLEKIMTSSSAILREVGTSKTVKYSNECFCPIKNLDPLKILEGNQYKFYSKILKTFGRLGDGEHRFKTLNYLGDATDNMVEITVRQKFGGMHGSRPYTIIIPWKASMTQKEIAKLLKEQGWLTKKFPKADEDE